jgi:hypothetical protein
VENEIIFYIYFHRFIAFQLIKYHFNNLFFNIIQLVIFFNSQKLVLKIYSSFTLFTSRKINICNPPLKKNHQPLLMNNDSQGVLVMKNRVVKAKNLLAFRIWLEKLGYSVKNLADNRGFTFSFKKEYGLVTGDLSGNALAMQLGEEFEDHLKA